MFPKSFKKKFQLVIAVLVIPIEFRLLLVAETTGNWRGFLYSTVHVLFVAGLSYYLLRNASKDDCQQIKESGIAD